MERVEIISEQKSPDSSLKKETMILNKTFPNIDLVPIKYDDVVSPTPNLPKKGQLYAQLERVEDDDDDD